MSAMKDFWSQDRTTIHQKSNWFERLPQLQRITYILLLLFVIAWCFYLGMSYAIATAPPLPDILDGSNWTKGLMGDDGEEINIVRIEGMEVTLLVGADKRPGEKAYRTDTIILSFFNGDTNELKLLSIPRDSYVQLPGTPTKTKINEAYFYGGMTLLENTIEYTLGIEVDKYVEMDFHAFLEVIDLLGGVEIDVPVRMYVPNEEINIQKGIQTLNGYDALAFVRFRTLPMGDIDRIANQQAFMRALASKLASNATIWKAPQLVNIAMEYTRTNYSLTEAMQLGSAILQSDLNNIGMYTLPGVGLWIDGGSYWVLSKERCLENINEITGGNVGDMHIISDGGRGTTAKPKPQNEDEENPDEEAPLDETPDTEGSWSSGPGDEEQPSGEQPSGEQPSGEQPTGEQPTGEQPTGEQPTGEQPTGEQPTGEQPPAEQPPAEQPPAANGGTETPVIPEPQQ